MDKLIQLLDSNARLNDAQLAVMLDRTEEEVKAQIASLEREGVIRGFKAVIDWEKTDRDTLTALIELRVTPQPDRGFEEIAEQISLFDEVESVYLMSGAFDLTVIIEGRTMKEVALFVGQKLAVLDSVISTSTHFVLKKYKDHGLSLIHI